MKENSPPSAFFYHSPISIFLPLLALQMPNEGSLVLIIILIVLQGVTGISFGLVISSAIDDEQSANQAALGIFYPNLIISGRLNFYGAKQMSQPTNRCLSQFEHFFMK